MLERIILWGLVKSGHRRIGNYVLLNGIFVHKSKILMDFIFGALFCGIVVGWGLLMYMAFKYII